MRDLNSFKTDDVQNKAGSKLLTKIALDRYLGTLLVTLFNPIARAFGFLLRRDHSSEVRGDILVVKMLGGGSLVIAYPALLGIRKKYPDVKIRLLTTKAVTPFANTLGVFDEILAFDDSSFARTLLSSFCCLLASVGSDTVLDLETYSFLSTVFSLFTCARNRIGFFFDECGFRQSLHTHRIFFNALTPLYLHYDRVAEIIGASIVTPEECRAKLKSVLGLVDYSFPQRRIAVGCGCSFLSSNERKLTPDQWAEHVFENSDHKDYEVVFLGGASDIADAESIILSVRRMGVWKGEIKNLCGTMPLLESLKVLATCDEFWGIDSSLLHYARLFGITSVSFFGPTMPASRLRPIEGLEETIYYNQTICSPCIHLTSVPPCHGKNYCMKTLFDRDTSAKNWIPLVSEFYSPKKAARREP